MAMHMNHEKNTDKNESIIQAIDNTGVRMFLYFPQTKTITIPENTCAAYRCRSIYENMPDSFADDFVYQEDYENFKAMYYEIDRGVTTASAIFHSKDLKFCHHVTLTTVSWTEDGKPESALGIIENITDTMKTTALLQDLEEKLNKKVLDDLENQKSVSQVASAIGNLYYAIYHICLSDDSFHCFRENNEDVNTLLGERGVFSKGWTDYVEQFVQNEYKEEMYAFGDYKTLAQRLHQVDSISQNYQRIHVGWLKAQFIVAERDETGKAVMVVLAVYDINDEKKIDEQRKEAQFEAEHDPLTKLYNRKGFARISESKEYSQNKIGFMLMDIDNFKALNDCHGHDLGDHVLASVAEHLMQLFRNEDKIFRLGGDELAILLNNCDENAWKIICSKLSAVHAALAKEFSDGVNVTLSVGVCFTETGYSKELYMLADEALYATKKNGRAGCTMISENHEILGSWSDEAISFHPEHVLEYTTSGMFRMELPKDSHKERRIVCGDSVKAAFGADAHATPEECYRVWEKGVLPEYHAVVREAMEMMVREGHAECTYLWKHPQWGEIYVRSNAFGEVKDGVIILTGIHHVLRDTNLVEKKDDQELINTAMSEMYFGVLYLDLEHDTFLTVKTPPGQQTFKWGEKKTSEKFREFVSSVVDQADREKMREFLDLETMRERIGNEPYIACRYRSVNLEDGTQVRLIPVKYNAAGKLTHVLLVVLVVSTSNEAGAELINYDPKSLTALYNNVPAGIVMYEWNGKQFKTIHISEYYAREYGYTLMSENGENIGGPDFKRVHPDDLEGYQNAIRKALGGSNILQYLYRVWNRTVNQYLWVKVDAVAKPQPDGKVFIYAVYTDISEQKVAQQRLEKNKVAILSALESADQYIYEYDPVKHTSTCFTESDNGYHLNHVIDDYPECFRHTDFMHPDDVEMFIDTVHKIETGAQSAHCEIRVQKQGKEHWHSCTFHSFYDAEKGYNIAILTVIDITSNKSMLQKHTDLMKKWKYESEHDRLTGLLNREAVFHKCRELLETHPEEQFVMLHCDIQHFHLYNTFFGDEAGDQLLCKIAEFISNMSQDYDYWAYGRIESDVFCSFFPIGPGHFERHVNYFLKELGKIRDDFLISAAIGAYWVTNPAMSMEEMFSRATIAAKSGKINLFGSISCYDEEMDRNLKEMQMVSNEMNKAIEDEEFKVFLQPKYSLRSEKIVGAEALARWQHPDRGMISPGIFIPVIEKNGSIAELDRYMWEHVCQILRRWSDEGRPMYPVSVNISRVSMYNKETVPFLKKLVQKYNLDPKYLELELTETAYMDDPEDLKRMLRELQEFGFSILIDDFGSGYSSLNTLRNLPVNILKLDMKFLSEIENDSRGLAVLSSVVRMSKLLNLPIVAEGVERKEQADYLRSIGCEYVQGFLYAKPMPVCEYEKLISEADEIQDAENSKDEASDSVALADIVLEEPFMPVGVLEYDKEHFAYLRTNKKFLREFDLIENLKPASKVFQEHMDDRSYHILLQTFANCSETKRDSICSLKWLADDGTMRKYHGYVHYHGMIGNYADLAVTFMNVTEIDKFGFEN